jgi:hypothetical protein
MAVLHVKPALQTLIMLSDCWLAALQKSNFNIIDKLSKQVPELRTIDRAFKDDCILIFWWGHKLFNQLCWWSLFSFNASSNHWRILAYVEDQHSRLQHVHQSSAFVELRQGRSGPDTDDYLYIRIESTYVLW